MTVFPDRRIPPAIQDSESAQAFADYAGLIRQHSAEPDRWDDPERMEARDSAHARFLELFEAGL